MLIKNMSAEKYKPITKREQLRGRKPDEKPDKKYPYCKRLNRLQSILSGGEVITTIEQIESLLFDNLKFNKKGTESLCKYDGKIAGINARIVYSKKSSCLLYTKSESDWQKVSKKISERRSKLSLEDDLY